MGKIAYGRRKTEKKIGTRNEMHIVAQAEFPVYEGQHEGIVSEEDWNLAQSKRKRTGVRKETAGKSGYVSLLSTVIKCPCCGKSMYSNPKRPSGKDTKTRYYYYCKNTGTATGHKCDFRTNIEQSEIDNFVAGVISAMVHNPQFEKAIKDKIGTVVDTTDMQKELEVYRQQLRQILTTKARLEKRSDGCWVRNIVFNFPVPVGGKELPLENATTLETVCHLSKLSGAKHHVEVELNLDEMGLTSAESKATYDEIRDYVMEQTGLHVTNLNIAQIKRKCGIIERENYNLPKSEDSRQPNCTKEKEEAIKEAFSHFGMI